MEVITSRPIYNYADGADDYSNLKGDKNTTDQSKPNIFQKAYQGVKSAVESDWGKAVVGATTDVGSAKLKKWAGTGTSAGNIIEYDPNKLTGGKNDLALIDENKDDKKGMGIWTKVGIGLGIVAVLGVTTYFILKSKKGKPSK